MATFQINDDERAALRGLPHLAQLIYVFGMRPFMDYSTGVVGRKRGISWKSIAEELYIEPHSGLKDTGERTEKELRRAAVWLERAGLIGPNQASRKLIHELLLATRDQSKLNKVGSIWAEEQGDCSGRERGAVESAVSKTLAVAGHDVVGAYVGGGDLPQVGTPPLSVSSSSSSCAQDAAAPELFWMHPAWIPSHETWRALLGDYGISPAECTAARLLEFRDFWLAERGKPNRKPMSQAQWEHKFAQSLRCNVDHQAAVNTASATKRSHLRSVPSPPKNANRIRPLEVSPEVELSSKDAEVRLAERLEEQGIPRDPDEARAQVLARGSKRGKKHDRT